MMMRSGQILRFLNGWPFCLKMVLLIAVAGTVAYVCCLPRQLFDVPYSTVVADRDGRLLGARISADGQWRFPPCSEVPEKVKACLVAFEDKRFYLHRGVDVISMLRACWQNLRAGRVVSGGSTLTMQTIRLARQHERTLGEKLVEMVLATRLEHRSSKDEILALYVSHAPFGGNVVGLDAAAWRYFGHAASDLSWAEAATLAVLPNAPSMIHLSKGRDALLAKRNRLLRTLFHRRIIDEATCALAMDEPLPGEPKPLPQIAPHLVDYFAVHRKGLYTHSSVDRDLQVRVEDIVRRWSDEFGRSDIRNLAVLVIDLRTNLAVAYCGNARFEQERDGNKVDVIRSPRSTGSILKPFLYCAMLQEGSLLPAMLLPDVPVNINGFSPQNFNRQFEGAVPASEALARSLNVPAVHMLQHYGVAKFHSLLRQAGLSTLRHPASHYGLSLILGGAEATLWDVTAAYADMGRTLLGLPTTECGVLLSDSARTGQKASLFLPGAVWQTFQALVDVNRPEELDWKSLPSVQPVAWKTGTSYGFRDAWAVGVTSAYAVGVWVGNASGEGKPGLVGARTAGPVLFDVLGLLPSTPWFACPYDDFIEAEVCHQSGHLKSRFCDETDTVLLLPAALKSEACPYHQPVTLSADHRWRLYEQCARTEPSVQCHWFALPPVWEWYYRQFHPEYQPLPPYKPGCGEAGVSPMQFIYPSMNALITLPRQMDGSEGQFVAKLAHSSPHAIVFWHLDDEYLGQTEDFHQQLLRPSSGRHTLTAVDGDGNTVSVSFTIRGAVSAE